MSAPFLPSCDRAMAQASACTGTTDASTWVLATTILASSLAFIDGSVVNVGLPAIARSFPEAASSMSWVISGYLLPLSALLLLGGAAGDRFGHRRVLLCGVALFALASLLCAAAPDFAWLLAGRVLQGIGAALLMPTSLAILGGAFSGPARGKAIGTWAAAGAAAGAVGPLLGGWLIDVVGWRSMFFINLPIAVAVLVLGARFVRDAPAPAEAPLDLAGAALATAGLAGVTWGLSAASEAQRWDALSGSMLAGGAALLFAFVWIEGRRGAHAMMPLALFSSPSFVGLSLVTLLLYGALGALLVLLPHALIDLNGYAATAAGAALLPLPLVIALTAPTMGRLAAKSGPRLPLIVGPAVVALGFLLALRIPDGASYWSAALPAMVMISLGMAGAVAPLTTAVLAAVAPHHSGVASGFNSAVARTGGLVATALSTAILASQGEALKAQFRIAMAVGAGVALAASVCAFIWLRQASPSPARE